MFSCLLVVSLKLLEEIVATTDLAAYVDLHQHAVGDGADCQLESTTDLQGQLVDCVRFGVEELSRTKLNEFHMVSQCSLDF